MQKKILSLLALILFTTTLFAQKVKNVNRKHKSNTSKILTPIFPPNINFQVGNFPSPKAPAVDFKKQTEITLLKGYSLVSCTVYFAGTGFPSVQVRSLKGNSLTQIQAEIDLCSAGSSITFTNIKIKGPDGIRTIDDVTYFLY